MKQVRPRVVVSRCLGFDNCRYDGVMIESGIVRALESHVAFVPVCPEVEIGLGVPRNPILIVVSEGQRRLVQPAGAGDLTDPMRSFASEFLHTQPGIDGFILKSRSPSCGIVDAKHFPSAEAVEPVCVGAGFFGGAVVKKFPGLPAEDEERLLDGAAREHFLTRLFTAARFRRVGERLSVDGIVRFHAENEYILKAYDRKNLDLLGTIAANGQRKPADVVYGLYRDHLARALERLPGRASIVDVLAGIEEECMGSLKTGKKQRFAESIGRYGAGLVTLHTVLVEARTVIAESGRKDLGEQTFLRPFPDELFETAAGRE